MTDNVGDEVRGGEEPSDENDWSFFLILMPLPFLTDKYPLPASLVTLISSGMMLTKIKIQSKSFFNIFRFSYSQFLFSSAINFLTICLNQLASVSVVCSVWIIS